MERVVSVEHQALAELREQVVCREHPAQVGSQALAALAVRVVLVERRERVDNPEHLLAVLPVLVDLVERQEQVEHKV